MVVFYLEPFLRMNTNLRQLLKKLHLNAAGITHGGFIAAFVDAGAGTAAHRSTDNNPCVTISLDLKFISAVRLGQELYRKNQNTKKN